MSRQWGRREFLQASGSAGVMTILAGCAGGSSTETQPPTERPPTPTSRPTDSPTSQPTSEPPDSEVPDLSATPLYLLDLKTDYHLDPEQDGRIEREYTAYAGDNRTTYTKTFSQSIYEFYANQSRQYVDNYQYKYGSYVSDQLDKYLMDAMVSEFETYGQENGHTERQVIEHMMSFVQNLEYTTDEAGTGWNDYPKYPLETLVQQEGDCEDTAILMANLLRNYGYGVKLIYATGDMTDEGVGGHMAVGIKGEDTLPGVYYEDEYGDPYYFIETTAPNNGIGDAPEWMNSAYLQPVGTHPLPGAVTATITDVSENEVTVAAETVNTGPVGSDRVQTRVSLIGADRYIIDQETSTYQSVAGFNGDLDTLGSAQQATAEMTLRVDEPKPMRLVSESLVRGSEVSQTESPLRRP